MPYMPRAGDIVRLRKRVSKKVLEALKPQIVARRHYRVISVTADEEGTLVRIAPVRGGTTYAVSSKHLTKVR